MRQVLTGFLVIVLPGCLTTHYGRQYSFPDEQLVYSCSEDESINHPFIKSISCAIENTGATWASVQVETFDPTSIDPNNKLTVLSADQIKSFLVAHQFEVEKNNYNTDMLLAGLIIGGTVASASGNDNISNVGLATSVGAIVAGTTIETREEYHKSKGNRYEFSQHHLLGPEFEIPPASFVRKTILIQSASDSVFKAWPKTIALCFAKPERHCTNLNFQNPRQRGH